MFTAYAAAPLAIVPYPIDQRGLHAAFGPNYAPESVAPLSMESTMAFATMPTPPVDPLTKVTSSELEAAGIDERELDLESLFGTARSKQRRKRVKLDHLSQEEKSLRRYSIEIFVRVSLVFGSIKFY